MQKWNTGVFKVLSERIRLSNTRNVNWYKVSLSFFYKSYTKWEQSCYMEKMCYVLVCLYLFTISRLLLFILVYCNYHKILIIFIYQPNKIAYIHFRHATMLLQSRKNMFFLTFFCFKLLVNYKHNRV